MELTELLQKLNNPPEGLTFYESGSRAMEKRRLAEDVDFYGLPLRGNLYIDSMLSALSITAAQSITSFVTEYTDYDFFCLDDKQHIAYLLSLGFYGGEKELVYRDTLAMDVYTHPDFNAQVVLRSDPLLYKTIFDTIPIPIYYRHLWKSSPHKPDRNDIRELFNTFFAVAQAAKEVK